MKIIIYSPTSTELYHKAYEKRALGGADYTLLKMCEHLAETENKVMLYSNIKEAKVYCNNKKDLESKYIFYCNSNNIKKQECDILIMYRVTDAIPRNVKFKKIFFYSQDDIDAPCVEKSGSEYFKIFDKVIVLSKYHRDQFIKRFDIEKEKMVILGNFIPFESVIKKYNSLDFIYASTPFRGLVHLAIMWKEIVKILPESKLHIYSSMKIYDGREEHFSTLYEKMQKLKGVVYHGSVPKAEVMDQMKKSFLMLYPNTFPETYCNVVNESKMCKLPVITSNLGALPETLGKAGILIDGNPKDPVYRQKFIKAVIDLVEDPEAYMKLVDECIDFRTETDYKKELMEIIN